MLPSVFLAIAAMLASALAFPAATPELDKRLQLNTNWTISGWEVVDHGPQRTVFFSAGAPYGYIDGFNEFIVRVSFISSPQHLIEANILLSRIAVCG
jgi:hypothetical protein